MFMYIICFFIIILVIMLIIYVYYVETHPYTKTGPITTMNTQRLIYFQGHPKQNGSMMITQICDQYQTISLLIKGIPECASRTLSNLVNLHAVRGNLIDGILDLDSAMIGPLKYYGYIDPHDTHTIIDGIYHRDHISVREIDSTNGDSKLLPVIDTYSLIGEWNSNIPDDGTLATDSIFKRNGFLNTQLDYLTLPVLTDPHLYDLSSFAIQIVKNNTPFSFNQKLIKQYPHAQHKLRVITYYYGPNYVSNYLMNNNGVFIEKHDFIQAITPLHNTCGGYVIVGRERDSKLELLAVTIPFGYTLLVKPRAIHGDSNLVGLYMMAMTGNHTAMATADTVYMKNKYGTPLQIYFNDTTQQPKLDLPREYQPLITSNKMTFDELKNRERELIVNISDPYVINPVVYNIYKTPRI